MRKGILIDYFFTIMILLCYLAFFTSCFSLFAAALGRINMIPMSDTTVKAIANGSMTVMLTSALLLIMLLVLFKLKISEDRSEDDEFKRKYISMFSDDTKSRQEFVELYRKKESA